ncbi:MAG: serine protease [Candidatus Electrothrix sp. AR3]|nr:serine protease [Candidatus Electrothrix sp. AR3]
MDKNTDSTLPDLLNNCVVRLSVKESGATGTGFFVGSGFVLTCAHVVRHGQDITVRWRGNDYPAYIRCLIPKTLEEENVSSSLFLDVALLRVDIPRHPCVLLEEGFEPTDKLYAIGFTNDYPAGETVLLTGAGWADFSVMLDRDQSLIKMNDDRIVGGMSGAPVLNFRTGAVCGMIKRTRNPDDTWGGYAIPSAAIFDSIEKKWGGDLHEIQHQFHKKHPEWLSAAERYSSEVPNRWLAWEEDVLDKRFKYQIDYHDTTLLPSPLTKVWEEFVNQWSWHDQINNILQQLLREKGKHQCLNRIIATYDDIDCIRNYREILNEVNRLNPQQHIAELDGILRTLHQQRKKTQHRKDLPPKDRELLRATYSLRKIVQDLSKLIENPQFHRCFCVMGALGSGRTHFIASLLGRFGKKRTACDYFLLPLFLTPPKDEDDLRGSLLDSLCKATGIKWQSLEECNRTLVADGKRVVVVLDDLQALLYAQSNLECKVRELIETTTQLYSLQWLFTLHDMAYDKVARQKDFWMKYGYTSEALNEYSYAEDNRGYAVAQHTGWIMLNELNRAKQFGFDVLKALGKDHFAAELAAKEAPIIRYLTQPFLAWIIKELSSTVDMASLVTLNFIGFVDRFWDDRQSRVAPDPLRDDQVKNCIKRLAANLVKNGKFNPLTEEVRSILSKDNLYYSPDDALTVLEKMSLLIRVNDDSWDNSECVELQFEVFWHRHLAAQLCKEWEKEIVINEMLFTFQETARKSLKSITASHVREGFWEFFLLLIDQNVQRDPARLKVVWRAWRLALEDDDYPVQAVFFAGARASAEVQQCLITHLQHTKFEINSERVLFALMYFFSECETISFPDRIELLQPHYEGISKAMLIEYFMFLSRRLVKSESNLTSLLAAMHYFAGSHLLSDNIAEELANLCWRQMRYLSEDITWSIVAYLKDDKLSAEKDYASINKKPRGCYFFREWILYFYCNWLVKKMGTDAYDIFAANMSYATVNSSFFEHIYYEAERETTLAFGRWYRHHQRCYHWMKDSERRMEMKEHRRNLQFYRSNLVERLYLGKTKHTATRIRKETAYFLIRHTGHIGKDRVARFVDAYFYKIINEMRKDPVTRPLLKKYPIQLNGNSSKKAKKKSK